MRPAIKLTLACAAAIALAAASVGPLRRWIAPEHPHAGETASAAQPAQAATPPPAAEPEPEAPPRDALDEFTSMLLAEAEDTWTQVFAEESDTYIPPRLRFFEGTTRSDCGNAVDGDGTFYCAPDHRLYIDKDFHRGMVERGAPEGSLAHAYVIAHSIGHHVQNLRGLDERLKHESAGMRAQERKALQVRVELQADCFAGIWAHNARSGKNAFKPAELDQALSLPASIGVELVKRHDPGVIVPDTYAHGTLPQRKRWFLTGYKHGLVKYCDTFTAHRQ
jgi:predicted metalloprotease